MSSKPSSRSKNHRHRPDRDFLSIPLNDRLMWFPAPDESTWIGLLRMKLIVPGSRSLKDKRKAIAQVRERTRARLHLSIAEVGHLEDHRHASMAITMVGNNQQMIRTKLESLRYDIESWGRVIVHQHELTILRPDPD